MRRYPFSVVFILLLTVVLGGASQAQTAGSDHVIVLHAARLFDVEDGRLLKPGEVLVKGDRIIEVGDLWEGILDAKHDLQGLLAAMSERTE